MKMSQLLRRCPLLAFWLVLLCCFWFWPGAAQADVGPKPSVVVEFLGMEQETFYATLLSATESTGPYSVPDPQQAAAYAAGQTEEDAIQRQFLSYQDEDGFHYLQFWQDCSGGQPFRWTYYPPREYKLLLYFPEQNQFVCSEIYQRYAFDSYYQLDAAGEKLSAMLTSGSIASADFSKHYDYTTEIWSLLARIVLTILLEMLLAHCFGFRGKKQLALLAGVNIATQVGLNVALNIVNYYQGQMAFVLLYFALELLICLVEALVYAKWLGSLGADGQKHTAKTVAYAILANVFSFGAGMALAYYLPGIF